MKKITTLILSLAMMFCFIACTKNTDKVVIDINQTEKPTENSTENSTEKPKVDYTVQYEDILADTYEFIKNIDDKVGPYEGMEAVWDAALALGDKALDEIGYSFEDLTGDGTPELLIGAFDKEDFAFTQNEIYVVYTLDNEEPTILLEGWGRSFYALKEYNKLFFMSSSGAAYQEFGTLYTTENKDVVFEDFYFTFPDNNDPGIIEIFHNNTGISYREESEKLDITLDDFWKLQDEAAKGTVKLTGTPFAKLDAEIIEKAMYVAPALEPEMFLGGEWVFSHGETDGYEYTAEEEGIESKILINIQDFTAKYYSKTEFKNDKFDAELEILEEPVYEGCGNDEWSVKFHIYNSTFGEDEEFYATLIDENTLLLQHLYPFDGTQGVSYQYYTCK